MSRKTLQNTTMKVRRLQLSGQDAVGGTTQVKSTVFQIPCRVRQLNATEQSVGGKNGEVSTHRIYCDKIDIQGKDECVINGIVYDVMTTNPISTNGDNVEIDVARRT